MFSYRAKCTVAEPWSLSRQRDKYRVFLDKFQRDKRDGVTMKGILRVRVQ